MNTNNMGEGISLKALSLEDSVRDFEIISGLLTDAGYKLDIFRVDGEEAFKSALQSNRFDIILADFNLPGFDAFGALHLRNELCPETPFICVSGSIGEETAIELIKKGAVDFVIKERPERLLLSVKRALEEAREKKLLKIAQEEVLSNLSLLRIAGHTAKIGGWCVDLVTNIITWSDVVADIYEMPRGYTPSVTERGSFYTTEWQEKNNRVFTACAQDGIPYDEEMEILTATGKRLWVRTIGEPVRDAKGAIIRIQGACQDITESKKVSEKVLKMARDWQATFNSSNDAVFVMDDKQQIQLANKQAENLFGKPIKDMIGRQCCEIVHHSSVPLLSCPVIRLKESLVRESLEIKIGEKWFEITVDPVLGDKGEYNGAIHVARDITVRRWSEKELIRGKDRLERLNAILQYQSDTEQELLDHALEESLYLTRSKVGYIHFYNPQKQIFTINSWSKEVMSDCQVINPQTEYQLEETGIFGEVVRQRKPFVVNDFTIQNEYMKGCPEGHVHLERFLSVPIFMGQEIVAVIGVANKEVDYDDTDILQLSLLMDAVWKMVVHRKAEEEKSRFEEQLMQIQKLESVGRLAGGVAHDFNNMLCIILGYAEALCRDLPDDGHLHKDACEIVNAAQRSATLTRQLLAFSRKQSMQPVLLDLNELLRNTDKMLRRLIGEDIVMIQHLEEPLSKITADPGQIEQVVMNLVVNARDAMPQGGSVIIETQEVYINENYVNNHQGVIPGHYVLMSVSDNGSGIQPEILKHIFEPFFTTKEMGKGTGLGLATVYGIVKQSGGNIWVYSEPGKGTTFKVYLPAFDGHGHMIQKKQDQKNRPGLGQTLLVVDDEEALRRLVEKTLSDLGYNVILAASGSEAISMIDAGIIKPDLIVSDVIMPGMDGGSLYQQLSVRQPGLKVLFMSGYTDNTISERGGLIAGLPFIQKPFNTSDLSEKIFSLLNN